MRIEDKFDFASRLLEKSLEQRDEFRKRFFDLLKFVPIAFASTGYLFSQKINNVTFIGEKIEWYNFFILLNALSLMLFSILAIFFYFFPPKYNIGASFRDQLKYIDDIQEYVAENDIEQDSLTIYQTQQLKVIAEDAGHNDEINERQRVRMNVLSIIAILLFLSYIVPILFLSFR